MLLLLLLLLCCCSDATHAMARDGPRRASMVQAGARIHGPGPRRREVAVLVAWPALTLGAGQGSRLLLRLLSGEHQAHKAPAAGQATTAAAWRHR